MYINAWFIKLMNNRNGQTGIPQYVVGDTREHHCPVLRSETASAAMATNKLQQADNLACTWYTGNNWPSISFHWGLLFINQPVTLPKLCVFNYGLCNVCINIVSAPSPVYTGQGQINALWDNWHINIMQYSMDKTTKKQEINLDISLL